MMSVSDLPLGRISMSNANLRVRADRKHRGVTVIELLVALAVAAVLIGVGMPAFNSIVVQRTLTTQANDFVLAVQYARSEASRRGQVVAVRAEDPSDSGDEWGPGWCVVVGTASACDGGSDVLRRFGPTAPHTFDAVGAINGLALIPFNARGFVASGVQGALHLCHPDAARDPGRELTLTRVGRISVAQMECHE